MGSRATLEPRRPSLHLRTLSQPARRCLCVIAHNATDFRSWHPVFRYLRHLAMPAGIQREPHNADSLFDRRACSGQLHPRALSWRPHRFQEPCSLEPRPQFDESRAGDPEGGLSLCWCGRQLSLADANWPTASHTRCGRCPWRIEMELSTQCCRSVDDEAVIPRTCKPWPRTTHPSHSP